jgi:hypothetical protein
MGILAPSTRYTGKKSSYEPNLKSNHKEMLDGCAGRAPSSAGCWVSLPALIFWSVSYYSIIDSSRDTTVVRAVRTTEQAFCLSTPTVRGVSAQGTVRSTKTKKST